MRRTFITFSYGEVYDKLCQILSQSIDICSKYKLVVFRPQDFNEDFTPELWQPGYIYKFKILSCLKALETYDEVVWLDTDCIVTPNIDKIWENQIDELPLIPIHRFNNFKNWPHLKIDFTDPNQLRLAKERVGCVDNNFENVYLQTCCLLINNNCKDFLNLVLFYYENFKSEVFPFSDETIINSLYWKYKYSKNLGDVFFCSHYFSPYILLAFLELKSKEDYPKLFDINFKHIFPTGENEDRILAHGATLADHNRIGVINNNSEQILFFHGTKNDWLHQMYLDCIKKQKNKGKIVIRLQGGMGNQMLQYAMARSLSEKLGIPFYLDRYHLDNYDWRNYDIDLFNIHQNFSTIPEGATTIDEGWSDLTFREDIWNFDYIGKETYLIGYFAHIDYFQSISDILRKEFTLKNSLTNTLTLNMLEKIKQTNSVMLNVRRTDFVNNSFHGTMDVDYYNKAIEIINQKVENPNFFIFSDDIDWCNQNLSHIQNSTIVDHSFKGDRFGEYLELMKSCKHFIIPNSTFAFWAAYLSDNKDKIVIAPEKWFLADNPKQDLICEKLNWIKI